MGKYDSLENYFRRNSDHRVRLSFSEIIHILGFNLPNSAYIHRVWWGNDRHHPHAHSWLNAGFKVESVDLKSREVIFVRTGTTQPRTEMDIKNQTPEPENIEINTGLKIKGSQFEQIVKRVVEEKFNTHFIEKKLHGVHKKFDFVSPDNMIVGDAKYYTMVRGASLPPAKFATIAEHVWLLEKLQAEKKFLVFGNDKRVPLEWLKRYGNLVKDVDFYFYDHIKDKMEKLN